MYPQDDGNFMCDVAIPDKETAFVYEKEILNRTNQNCLLWENAVMKRNDSYTTAYTRKSFLYSSRNSSSNSFALSFLHTR